MEMPVSLSYSKTSRILNAQHISSSFDVERRVAAIEGKMVHEGGVHFEDGLTRQSHNYRNRDTDQFN